MSVHSILTFFLGLLLLAVAILARQAREYKQREVHMRVLVQESKAFLFELLSLNSARLPEERLTHDTLNNLKMLEMLADHIL